MLQCKPPEQEPEEEPQYDGTGTYENDETIIWYDTDGQQHVEVKQ